MIRYCFILFFCFYASVNGRSQNNVPLAYITSDSVLTYASNRYIPSSFLQRLIMGSNYRKDWQTMVKLPVFKLSASAFTVKDLGGGMQTKSLHLTDSLGKQWALRTVDKDVSGGMPPWAHNTLAQKTMQDLTSASFPYGATVVSSLAKAASVYTSEPQLFFVADDTALGNYKSLFANTICLLEERDRGFDSTLSSKSLLPLIKQEATHLLDQKVLLRARLLDMLIADWDRHENNWRWGVKDSAGVKVYYAIPTDRDWAFYKSKGLIPAIIKFVALPFLDGFNKEMNVKTLSFKTWVFDKTLAGQLTRRDWEDMIKEFRQNITDSVIEAAVKTMPPEIYANNGGVAFIAILKSRRNNLYKEGMAYYRFLSENAVINGSDKDEIFSISGVDKGITVSVFQRSNGVKGVQLFSRTYLSNETNYITINGFAGEDVFEVVENISSKIKVKIYGGQDEDTYDIRSNLNLTIYDDANNVIVNKNKAKFRFQ
jgi:hypothetical protein